VGVQLFRKVDLYFRILHEKQERLGCIVLDELDNAAYFLTSRPPRNTGDFNVAESFRENQGVGLVFAAASRDRTTTTFYLEATRTKRGLDGFE
jgi:hypothetical protein